MWFKQREWSDRIVEDRINCLKPVAAWVCEEEYESRITAVEIRWDRNETYTALSKRVRNIELRESYLWTKVCVGTKVYMRKGMLRWLWHVVRMADGWQCKQKKREKLKECRYRGRPRQTYHDQIEVLNLMHKSYTYDINVH